MTACLEAKSFPCRCGEDRSSQELHLATWRTFFESRALFSPTWPTCWSACDALAPMTPHPYGLVKCQHIIMESLRIERQLDASEILA